MIQRGTISKGMRLLTELLHTQVFNFKLLIGHQWQLNLLQVGKRVRNLRKGE